MDGQPRRDQGGTGGRLQIGIALDGLTRPTKLNCATFQISPLHSHFMVASSVRSCLDSAAEWPLSHLLLHFTTGLMSADFAHKKQILFEFSSSPFHIVENRSTSIKNTKNTKFPQSSNSRPQPTLMPRLPIPPQSTDKSAASHPSRSTFHHFAMGGYPKV